MTHCLSPLETLDPSRFDSPAILKNWQTAAAVSRNSKGVAASIQPGHPHQHSGIAKPRTAREIENIVTTRRAVFKDDVDPDALPARRQEVLRFRQALRWGLDRSVPAACSQPTTSSRSSANSNATITGFRKLPGTALKGRCRPHGLHPPQDPAEIVEPCAGWNGSSMARTVPGRPAHQDGVAAPPV